MDNSFTFETKLLLICTRQQFLETHQAEVSHIASTQKIDWSYVYRIADAHGVSPLVYANLTRCSTSDLRIPTSVQSQFEQAYQQNVLLKQNVRKSLVHILAFLNQRSIDVMLLSSAVLDIFVYAKPAYTFSHDVDLLLYPQRYEISKEENSAIIEFFNTISKEYKQFTDRFPVEYEYFEYDYFEHHDFTLNDILPINFHKVWANSWEYKFDDRKTLIMCPEDLLISVCISSFRKRFFRLKNLCDVAETVQVLSQSSHPQLKLSWKKLVRKAWDYQCNDIIFAALYVAQRHLDLRLPNELLDQLSTNRLKSRVITFLTHRMSFSELADYSEFYSNPTLASRKVDMSLLLPHATYRLSQWWKKAIFIWNTRHNPRPNA